MDPQVGLVKVWILLQARVDTESIVREILGHFSLSTVGKTPSATLFFSFFMWIKVIFDLQRTYSQSPEPTLESRSYLLPPSTLFTVVHHILERRIQVYPQGQCMDEKNIRQRYFVARALLSGLRALQLRANEGLPDISNDKIEKLRELVASWWTEAKGNPSEQFVLEKCQIAISNIIQRPEADSVWQKPACGICELRDSQKVLYEALTEKAVNSFDEQLEFLRTDCKRREPEPFWALFDILWAAEVGYIQWRADVLSGKNVITYQSEMGTLVGKLAKLQGKEPENIPAAVLLLSYGLSLGQDTVQSLEALHQFLLGRQKQLVDYNLEIRKLSTELQEKINSWIRQESAYEVEDLRGEGESLLETMYLLSCPQLHIVPEHELRTRIDTDKHDIFVEPRLPKLLDLTALQIYCPRCKGGRTEKTKIKVARMIEPLQYISRRLGELANSSNVSQDSDDSEAPRSSYYTNPITDTDVELSLNTTPSGPSPSSPPAVSLRRTSNQSVPSDATSSAKEGSKLRSIRKILHIPSNEAPKNTLQDSKPKDKPKTGFQSYCFSANGRILTLWNKGKDHVYTSFIPTEDGPESFSMWDWKRFDVPRVILVASGGTRVAAVSKEGKQQKLLIFSISTNPVFEPIGEVIDQNSEIRSIAVSMDDKFVALGSDRELCIFDVENRSLSRPKLSIGPNPSVTSQRVNFSLNGEQVVMVTRQSDGHIRTSLCNRLPPHDTWNKITTQAIGMTDNDHGVSAALYDNNKKRVILTAYVNKPYSVVYSQGEDFLKWQTQDGKLEAAVYCTPGSQFILLSDSGKLYLLDPDKSTPKEMKSSWSFKTHRPKSNSQFVALAAPEINRIYTFRIENEEMILEVIRGKGKPVTKPFVPPELLDD